MKFELIPLRYWFVCMVLALCLVSPSTSCAAEDSIKLEVHLLWGTNDKTSPDPRHKPVEPAVKKKLSNLPLKWTSYFEVNRKNVEISSNATRREGLSDKCTVEIKNLGRSRIEVSLIGEGQEVVKQSQSLPRGGTIVVGGNAPNATAWLVLLKRID